jgi:outer membrane protein assembly factor BamB
MPAWPPEQENLHYDLQAEPVAMGETLFLPSSRDDSLTALDTRTGAVRWRFFAGGPIRFAPVAHAGKVFFTADDACLYCLNAVDGQLVWKMDGAPSRRLVLGNDRLISSWPARGGLVLHEGRLHFAAGIWPFMGIFLHAVDPDTGAVIWTNSGDGTNYTVQPHGAPAFAGVAPQGHLAASGRHLVVPGGRSTPGVYDALTGEQHFFEFDKRNGGHRVMASGDLFFVEGRAYLMKDGNAVGGGAPAMIDGDSLIASDPESILVRSAKVDLKEKLSIGKKGEKIREILPTYREESRDQLDDDIPGRWWLKAGDRFFAGGSGKIAAYERGQKKPVWETRIEGDIWTMLAADERLFVVTLDGRLHCFGAGPAEKPAHHALETTPLATRDDQWTALAKEVLSSPEGKARQAIVLGNGSGRLIEWTANAEEILALPEVKAGQAIALGIGSGRLIEELLLQSELHVVAVDPDPAKVRAIREKMAAAGLHGTRFSAIEAVPADAGLPPYLCNLIVSESPGATPTVAAAAFHSLRPYGGQAAFVLPDEAATRFSELIRRDGKTFAGAKLLRSGRVTRLIRDGALPGSADWTHQYGDPAQTVVSKDAHVKAPFGVLWFGGPSHDGILPRHGHGPSPQVAGGRLFIEGADLLRCVDVYTGRLWWERELPGIGMYYDTTAHFAGAGEIGSNYVSLPDRVYALLGDTIHALDAATGKTVREFKSPAGDDGKAEYWSWLAVSGDTLVAASAPLAADPPKHLEGKAEAARYASGSRKLSAYDRHSGERLWTREAALNFRHNNIALSADRVFVIDSLTDARASALARRGLKLEGTPKMLALDLRKGSLVWEKTDGVFGTFLNYSAEHDILLQAGSQYRDRAADEHDEGMMALRGRDGSVVWHDEDLDHGGPCLLWRGHILTNGAGGFGIDLQTGKTTGVAYKREYGCNTAIGSEHLLTFRSGAAGFFDLENFSGTGNLGGFRSSCTNNLIPANGVLNAPDYTRTCTCSYQNQTSLALIHMPEAEFWTYGGAAHEKRVGVNFGAPGDRRAPDGTLWIEYPSIGGKSDEPDIEVEGRDVRYFRAHSSTLAAGGELPWVAASGVEGADEIEIDWPVKASAEVSLYFSVPKGEKPGDRVFDIEINGKMFAENFDPAKAGAAGRGIVKIFSDVAVKDEIEIQFRARAGRPIVSGVSAALAE